MKNRNKNMKKKKQGSCTKRGEEIGAQILSEKKTLKFLKCDEKH